MNIRASPVFSCEEVDQLQKIGIADRDHYSLPRYRFKNVVVKRLSRVIRLPCKQKCEKSEMEKGQLLQQWSTRVHDLSNVARIGHEKKHPNSPRDRTQSDSEEKKLPKLSLLSQKILKKITHRFLLRINRIFSRPSNKKF